ncbi:hypothetical protein SSX86_006632 [Deinandra increscens subsp. villosa]|uniref:Uncharacterized protein n=1 Tax=Deinandra increscens subsp. villosa TaxID=3103831 RepID=A0AAP0H6Z5_9ASTR
MATDELLVRLKEVVAAAEVSMKLSNEMEIDMRNYQWLDLKRSRNDYTSNENEDDIIAHAKQLQLYSPKGPLVDVVVVVLWLTAFGTILCASYWSAWSAHEKHPLNNTILKDHGPQPKPLTSWYAQQLVAHFWEHKARTNFEDDRA